MNNLCIWKEIHGFASPSECLRFRSWIQNLVDEGIANETPTITPYGGIVVERWFRHIESDEVWRLVAPEAPFYGVFEKVPSSEQLPLKNLELDL